MPSITIRDVPDATRDGLAARAAGSGRSLQEYLRLHLIALAERPDPSVLAARVRNRKQHTDSNMTTTEIIDALEQSRR